MGIGIFNLAAMFKAKAELVKDNEFLKAEVADLETEVHELCDELVALDEQKRQLEEKIATIESKSRAIDAPVEVNFSLIKPVSIERMCNDGTTKTIIGYFLDNKYREMYFYINNDLHAELVVKFRAWMESK